MPKHQFFSTNLHLIWRYLMRKRGYFWRGFISWLIGAIVLLNNHLNQIDTRLKIRGNQTDSKEIVLLTLTSQDIPNLYSSPNYAQNYNDFFDITDSYFWNLDIWTQMLEKLLSAQVRKIGVSLVFGESLAPISLTAAQRKLIYNSKIVWAGLSSNNDLPTVPLFAKSDYSNVGAIQIPRDEDGIIRKVHLTKSEFSPFAKILAGSPKGLPSSSLINYRGDNRVFRELSLTDFLSRDFHLPSLKDKIVIIGSLPNRSDLYLTPLGQSNRHTILAHMTDNVLGNRFIQKSSSLTYLLLLLLILGASMFIITRYSQSLSLLFLLWFATLWTAVSAWLFDTFYYWLPVSAPLTVIFANYFILLGYQANKIERKHFQLQQEQKYLHELEQLKNNFVSLISHDLKTPIAKIQSVLNRILLSQPPAEMRNDLKTLQESSEELNRYIQSIIHMLRVESRDFRLHLEVGDVNEVIQDAVNQLRPLAQEKQIRLNLNLEPMFSIEFDHTLLREVLVNLVENAIKYTPQGREITISSLETEHNVVVEVKDTGEGIPETEISAIWGKFVRGKDQDLKTKGTGLGLYLVKYFIELHGGKVSLDSKVGAGTTVSFSLPVEGNHTGKALL